MSNTPRTDELIASIKKELSAEACDSDHPYYVLDLAARELRTLERENTDLLEKLRAATSMPCAPSATGKPVAWLYEEHGERMFGHPDGYRPTNAVPLYAPPVEETAKSCIQVVPI